ncbi:hypothetical protein NDU88_006454 [Pleurodeles waltl]|uniref:Uncharacterized protein n=1 Tax=Pleurodeles waltl TaxID=8319 RepID=A0AAV7TXW7_PLEWA|nr:hypothetical protein NDU88_006454 [Pleurodeles waltl]
MFPQLVSLRTAGEVVIRVLYSEDIPAPRRELVGVRLDPPFGCGATEQPAPVPGDGPWRAMLAAARCELSLIIEAGSAPRPRGCRGSECPPAMCGDYRERCPREARGARAGGAAPSDVI